MCARRSAARVFSNFYSTQARSGGLSVAGAASHPAPLVRHLVANSIARRAVQAYSTSCANTGAHWIGPYLTQRAALVFAPSAGLLCWWYATSCSSGQAPDARSGAPPGSTPQPRRSLAASAWHAARLAYRTAYLAVIFTPVLLLSPLSHLHPRLRRLWQWVLFVTMNNSGPAFIKWAQWAATRPDLLPKDTRDVLEKLQTAAPSHRFGVTRATIEAALGCELAELFSDFSEAPIASGAIAQVHKATLSELGARLTGHPEGMEVAVKVRHPHVSGMLELDFIIMVKLAALACKIPGLQDSRLDDSMRQFELPFQQQVDLACEAEHLDTFNHNFRLWRRVRFPKPLWPLVSEDVLVESFEPGSVVSSYVKRMTPYNARIADVGLRSYLQMVLKDNFLHGDLHPGNLLVRVGDEVSTWSLLAAWLDPLARSLFGVHDLRERCSPVELSVLDVGMTASLRPDHQQALIRLYQGLARMDGPAIADSMLSLRHMESTAHCDLHGFKHDVVAMFAPLDRDSFRTHTQEVVGEVLDCLRHHKITMDGGPSAVLVTTLVLEGWSTRLNPDIHIMETICELLPQTFRERMPRVVDRLVCDGSLAFD